MGIRIFVCWFVASLALAQNYPVVTVLPQDASTVGEIRLRELLSNGSNYLYHKGPASLASTVGYTWPAPAAGCIQSDAGGVISIGSCGGGGAPFPSGTDMLLESTVGSSAVHQYTTAGTVGGFILRSRRARGTIASPTDVAPGDVIYAFSSFGYKDGDYRVSNSVQSYVEAVGTNYADGQIVFFMTNAGSGFNAGSIHRTGNWNLGASGDTGFKASVAGTFQATGNSTFGASTTTTGNHLFAVNEVSNVGSTTARGNIAYFKRFDAHDGTRSRVAIVSPGAGSDACCAIAVTSNAGLNQFSVSYNGTITAAGPGTFNGNLTFGSTGSLIQGATTRIDSTGKGTFQNLQFGTTSILSQGPSSRILADGSGNFTGVISGGDITFGSFAALKQGLTPRIDSTGAVFGNSYWAGGANIVSSGRDVQNIHNLTPELGGIYNNGSSSLPWLGMFTNYITITQTSGFRAAPIVGSWSPTTPSGYVGLYDPSSGAFLGKIPYYP